MPSSQDSPATLAKAMAVQTERLENIWKYLYGNGQPGLEKRLMTYICEEIAKVTRHGNANMQEGDGLMLDALKRETAERNRQHAENKEQHAADKAELSGDIKDLTAELKEQGKTLGRIKTWGIGIGFAFLILKGAEDLGIIKVIGAQEVQHKIQSFVE